MLYPGFKVNGAGQVEHHLILSDDELELLWGSIHARIGRWENHDCGFTVGFTAPLLMVSLEGSLWEIIKPAEEGVTE